MYYAPFRRCTHRVAPVFSLDLHVLGTPPTFVLSQDQTLQSTFLMKRDRGLKKLQVIRSLVKTQNRHVFRTCLKGPISSRRLWGDSRPLAIFLQTQKFRWVRLALTRFSKSLSSPFRPRR